MRANTTTRAEPELLARVRAELAAQLAADPRFAEAFAEKSEASREREVLERAYESAVGRASVGRATSRINEMAGELRDALEDLIRDYPDNEAFRTACRAAILAAGLPLPDPAHSYFNGPTQFDGLPCEARGWYFVVNMMYDLTMNYRAPEPLAGDGEDEPDEGDGLPDLTPKLLPAFLSRDAARILATLATMPRPVTAKEVARSTGVDRTKCYVLLGDLRERGLLVNSDEGWQLASPEVWDLARRATQAASAGAA